MEENDFEDLFHLFDEEERGVLIDENTLRPIENDKRPPKGKGKKKRRNRGYDDELEIELLEAGERRDEDIFLGRNDSRGIVETFRLLCFQVLGTIENEIAMKALIFVTLWSMCFVCALPGLCLLSPIMCFLALSYSNTRENRENSYQSHQGSDIVCT